MRMVLSPIERVHEHTQLSAPLADISIYGRLDLLRNQRLPALRSPNNMIIRLKIRMPSHLRPSSHSRLQPGSDSIASGFIPWIPARPVDSVEPRGLSRQSPTRAQNPRVETQGYSNKTPLNRANNQPASAGF